MKSKKTRAGPPQNPSFAHWQAHPGVRSQTAALLPCRPAPHFDGGSRGSRRERVCAGPDYLLRGGSMTELSGPRRVCGSSLGWAGGDGIDSLRSRSGVCPSMDVPSPVLAEMLLPRLGSRRLIPVEQTIDFGPSSHTSPTGRGGGSRRTPCKCSCSVEARSRAAPQLVVRGRGSKGDAVRTAACIHTMTPRICTVARCADACV
jgi:hypothetical protein